MPRLGNPKNKNRKPKSPAPRPDMLSDTNRFLLERIKALEGDIEVLRQTDPTGRLFLEKTGQLVSFRKALGPNSREVRKLEAKRNRRKQQ